MRLALRHARREGASPRLRSIGLVGVGILLASPSASFAADPWGLQGWSVEQLRLAIPPGGRANTIALHPNGSVIWVASESGGLFRSGDGGGTWKHVDSLPVFYTNAVTVLPSDPETVLVTATEDFSASSRGGIWRSDNGGKSWTHVPVPAGTAGSRVSAFEISIAPDTENAYVALSDGVAVYDASGKAWTHVDPFGAGDRRVVSVVALSKDTSGENRVLAGGPAGIRRSIDGGTTWTVPSSSMGAVEDMHAFSRSPLAPDEAYVVAPIALDPAEQKGKGLTCGTQGTCGYMVLYRTPDAGDHWEQTFVAPQDIWRPNGGGCGGIGFSKAVAKGSTLDLYVSNRCIAYERPPGAYTWKTAIRWDFDPNLQTSVAGDTRDIAFDAKGQPVLAATDGGLIVPPGGASMKWTFAGADGQGNQPNGYNAFQLYEVAGQWIGGSLHDVYFGTQDNALWSSNDSGNTWTRCCNEGGYFQAQHHVAAAADSQITFNAADNLKLSGPLFTLAADDSTHGDPQVQLWDLPDCPKCGKPTIVEKDFHVQGVDWVVGGFQPGVPVLPWFIWSKGLAVSHTFGASWQQYATFGEDRRDLPRLSFGSQPATPVLYQAFKQGWDGTKGEVTHLIRIDGKPGGSAAEVLRPSMTGLGGIGTGPTMHDDIRVFDVDPADPDHLIAADVVKDAMKETWDGGESWKEMPQLTSLVRDGGKLDFSGRVYFSPFSSGVKPVSQASAIRFCPDRPASVAVGTVQSGVFVSTDRGKDGTWTKVPNSERATLISSFYWRKPDDILVATYGRGLWRLRFHYLVNVFELPCKSPDCFHVYYLPPPKQPPRPYDGAIVAFGGRIEGARVVDGVLRQVFVRPGTTVVSAGTARYAPEIEVTETPAPARFEGIAEIPAPPEGGAILTGLTLWKRKKESELSGFLFSPSPRSMAVPEPPRPPGGRPPAGEPSPVGRKPFLELRGDPVAMGGTIRLVASGLSPRTRIAVAIERVTAQTLVTDAEGTLSAALPAPTRLGSYAVTLVDPATGRVLDGVMVSIRPEDGRRSGPSSEARRD